MLQLMKYIICKAFDFYRHQVPSPFFDGVYDLALSGIVKYCFRDLVKSYPIFRLKQSGYNKKTGKAVTLCGAIDIFVLDEFVQLIKDNNLTGFKFEEVYDSETFNLTKETADETKTPAEEITAFNGEKCTMEKIMIPLTHGDGVFTPDKLGDPEKITQNSRKWRAFTYDGKTITNSANGYTVNGMESCDMKRDIRAAYREGRLQSVYVVSGRLRFPVDVCIWSELSLANAENIKNRLVKAVLDCVTVCADDLMYEMKKAPSRLEPLSFKCTYDGMHMDISLQERGGNIYSVGNIASHLIRCTCLCAGEYKAYGRDYGYKAFELILRSLYEKLSAEIPEEFEVSSDFILHKPEITVQKPAAAAQNRQPEKPQCTEKNNILAKNEKGITDKNAVPDSKAPDPYREKAPEKIKVYEMNYSKGCRIPSFPYDCNSDNAVELMDILINKKIEFDSSKTFNFDFCDDENKPLCDFMQTNLALLWVASKRAKEITESAYGDIFSFFPVENTDEHGNEYYVFIPSEYIELTDVIDIEKSWFRSRPTPPMLQPYEGIYDYYDIAEFCFKANVKNHPVFFLKQSGRHRRTGKEVTIYENTCIFVLDEFVRFVRENNLTGFSFVPVYDSENFESKDEPDVFDENFIIIPKAHENGVFTPAELGMPKAGRPFNQNCTGGYITVEYDGSMITNRSNDYTVYDIDNCDLSKDIRVTYSKGNLQSVYVFSGGERLPVYISYAFLPYRANKDGIKKKLMKTGFECIMLCVEDLMNGLKNYPYQLEPLSFEYYYDGEQMNINLQDRKGNVYPIGNTASHLLRCICNCAGELNFDAGDFSYKAFEFILKGVRMTLSEEIPKRFKVSGDFEVSEPIMYD